MNYIAVFFFIMIVLVGMLFFYMALPLKGKKA
jgi:hypothetical protein